MIATQIESLSQELRSPELSQGLWTGKKGKKNVSGLFSKLLSGLLKNPGEGLSGVFPEDAGEGGKPGARIGKGPDKTPGKTLGEIAGKRPDKTPGGKFPGKTEGQKAPGSGWGLSPGRGKGAGTEEAGALKKTAGKRKGEEAGEALYLPGGAGILAGKRVPEDPGRAAPDGEGAESLVLGEEISFPEDPEASGLIRGTAFSGSGLDSPDSGEAAAGDRGNRIPQGAEAFSGLGGKAGEASRFAEGGPGLDGAGKTEKELKRPAETRKTERRRERPVVLETRDLRDGQDAGALSLKEGSSPEGKRLSAQEIGLSVELKNESRGSESASSGGEKTLPQAFEDILARELHQNLNGDIVRHASVVLRDGGEGLIRLSLKPDTLGNVKIRLEMAENKITGHIVVESDEALRAFEREIGALEQAFKDSGFDSADLNMSLASGDPGADRRREDGEGPFFSERFAAERAASRYDALTEKTDVLFAIGSANGLKPGNGRISVNLLI
ncbi:MAG: flagellar hook-length control protein FliK [Treponema sp.]|nr:flagellar hook-length control protein FliK [Treponema sp.]